MQFCTSFLIVHEPGRREYKLLFGIPEKILVPQTDKDFLTKTALFLEGKVVGYHRICFSNYFRKTNELFVIKTGQPKDKVQSIPGVAPGAKILLHAQGEQRVRDAVNFLEKIASSGKNLEEIPEKIFIEANARLSVNLGLSERFLSFLRLGVFVSFLAFICGALLMIDEPVFIINKSPSVPLGIYWIDRMTIPKKGDIVIIDIPESIRQLAYERKYVSKSAKLLKPLAANGNDEICLTKDQEFKINGESFGYFLDKDADGKKMPKMFSGCEKIRTNEIGVASKKHNSFDSRYFGPVPKESIVGKAKPVWIWNG